MELSKFAGCRISPETAQGADSASVVEARGSREEHQDQDELEHQDSRSEAAPPAREVGLTRHLVDDTLLAIFGLLSNSDLVSAGQVCRRWRSLAQRPGIWARRRVHLFYDRDRAQVLRILLFAPRLDKFDWPFEDWSPAFPSGKPKHPKPSLNEELLRTHIDIRSLNVRHPTAELLQLHAGSLQELDVFTGCASVLKVIATQCNPLQTLSLCLEKSTNWDIDLLRWLFVALQKHRVALGTLILDLGRPRLNEQSTSRLMQALAQCPNLRLLDMVSQRLSAVDLRVLGSLPLQELRMRIPFKDLQGELRLPSSLRDLTIYFLRCPLRARSVRALARACADLPALKSVYLSQHRNRDDDNEWDECDSGDALKAAIKPGVKVDYYCNCPPSDDDDY